MEQDYVVMDGVSKTMSTHEIDPDPDKDRLFVAALARGLDVLAAFRDGEAQLSNQQLARRTGLPKSTVSRLTHTLTRLGYLVAEDGGYALGFATLSLAAATLARFDVRRHVAPLLRDFARQHQVSASLATRDGAEMVYLETLRSAARISVQLSLGSRVPVTRTAIGRAYLAGLDPVEFERVMAELGATAGDGWAAERAAVDAALADYRRRGYTRSYGGFEPDVAAVGVPLRLPLAGQPVLAINASGPAYQLDIARLENEIAPALMALAAKLGAMAA